MVIRNVKAHKYYNQINMVIIQPKLIIITFINHNVMIQINQDMNKKIKQKIIVKQTNRE